MVIPCDVPIRTGNRFIIRGRKRSLTHRTCSNFVNGCCEIGCTAGDVKPAPGGMPGALLPVDTRLRLNAVIKSMFDGRISLTVSAIFNI